MKVVLSTEAAERLEAQIAFLRSAEAFDAAASLRVRVMSFLSNHLAHFPARAADSRTVTFGRCGYHARVWCFGTESNMNASWSRPSGMHHRTVR